MDFIISFPNPVDFKAKHVGFVLQTFWISACVVLSLQAPASEGVFPRTTANLRHYSVHCFCARICIPVKELSVHTTCGINAMSTLVPDRADIDTDMRTEMFKDVQRLCVVPLPQPRSKSQLFKDHNGLSHDLLPLLVEAVVASMRNGARRHGRGAIWCMLLACGAGCFVAPPRVGLYRASPQRRQARLRLSLKNVSFWEVASAVADAAKCTTGSYLKKVNCTATAFLERRDAVDREDAIASLSEQMTIKGKLLSSAWG